MRETPKVRLPPVLLENAFGVVAPRRSVTSSLMPAFRSTRRAPGRPRCWSSPEILNQALPSLAGVAQVADRVALAHIVVDAIAVRIDRVAEGRHRERAPCEAAAEALSSRWLNEPKPASTRAGWRLRHAGLGDDVDDAADGAVAVQHRAAVAAGDFDALDAVARDRAEIDAGEIDVGQPAPVEQHQRVGDRRRAEAAQVDRGAGAVLAAGRADGLDTHLLRQHVLQRRAGRARDVLGGDDAGGGADNSGAGAARPDIDRRQHLSVVLRLRGASRQAGQRDQRAADKLRFVPMTQRSFVCARGMRRIG